MVYQNLGIKGVYPGDPDGIFTGQQAETHDASGGTVTRTFTHGANPDMLLRLNWFSVTNAFASDVGNLVVSLITTIPYEGDAQFREILRAVDITIRNDVQKEWINGLWVHTQKRDVDGGFLRVVTDNENGAVVTTMFAGFYWYMGRLRRREMAGSLDDF